MTIIFILLYITLAISTYLDIRNGKNIDLDIMTFIMVMMFNYSIYNTTNQIKNYIPTIDYAITDISDTTVTYKLNGKYKTIKITNTDSIR